MKRHLGYSLLSVLLGGCGASYAEAPRVQIGAVAPGAMANVAGVVATGDTAGGATAPAVPEKIMVEARARLSTEDLAAAVAVVRRLARELGGKVANDEVYAETGLATFVLRLPPERVDAFFEQLEAAGELTERQVKATDVTGQFVDYQIQLDNLQKSLLRYQEILAAATKVDEMLAVEAQLARVKGEIERIKGGLSWLGDRVDLSTIHLTVEPKDRGATFAPRAKLHPGVRYSYLAAFARGAQPEGFYGPGLSLHVERYWHLDVDVLSDAERDPFRSDAIFVSTGGEVYSDFLGRGKRTWLNPYLGLLLGYGRIGADDAFTMTGSLGVELYKSSYVLLDLNLRAHVVLGEGPARLAVQPTLGLNIAF